MEDKFWSTLLKEAALLQEAEPVLSSHYHNNLLNHESFADALAFLVASRLGSEVLSSIVLNEVFLEAIEKDSSIVSKAKSDINAYLLRDPACDLACRPFLFYKGFLAIQAYRFAHCLWCHERQSLARYLQHRISTCCDVDIHPAAEIGSDIMLDHATGFVVGETAKIGNNVSILHGVTLGGTGCQGGDRHPKVGDGVLISTGAKLLGNITIGDNVKVGAGSIVLESVPDSVTVVGVPAKIVGSSGVKRPAFDMDQAIEP